MKKDFHGNSGISPAGHSFFLHTPISTAVIYSVSFGRTGSPRLDQCSCLLRDTQDCFALTAKVHFVKGK